MAQLGFDTIILEGLLLGGDDTLTTRAGVALKAWLRKEAVAWPWQQCIKRYNDIALPSHSSLTVGSGAGGISTVIHEIKKPVDLYSSDFRKRARINTVQYDETHLGLNQVIAAGLQQYAIPSAVKITQTDVYGERFMEFFPVPDQAYLLSLLVHIIPADVSGTTQPWYPEDETMIEFVAAYATRWNTQNALEGARQVVASKVVDDRLRHGGAPGYNEDLELDPAVYR